MHYSKLSALTSKPPFCDDMGLDTPEPGKVNGMFDTAGFHLPFDGIHVLRGIGTIDDWLGDVREDWLGDVREPGHSTIRGGGVEARAGPGPNRLPIQHHGMVNNLKDELSTSRRSINHDDECVQIEVSWVDRVPPPRIPKTRNMTIFRRRDKSRSRSKSRSQSSSRGKSRGRNESGSLSKLARAQKAKVSTSSLSRESQTDGTCRSRSRSIRPRQSQNQRQTEKPQRTARQAKQVNSVPEKKSSSLASSKKGSQVGRKGNPPETKAIGKKALLPPKPITASSRIAGQGKKVGGSKRNTSASPSLPKEPGPKGTASHTSTTKRGSQKKPNCRDDDDSWNSSLTMSAMFQAFRRKCGVSKGIKSKEGKTPRATQRGATKQVPRPAPRGTHSGRSSGLRRSAKNGAKRRRATSVSPKQRSLPSLSSPKPRSFNEVRAPLRDVKVQCMKDQGLAVDHELSKVETTFDTDDMPGSMPDTLGNCESGSWLVALTSSLVSTWNKKPERYTSMADLEATRLGDVDGPPMRIGKIKRLVASLDEDDSNSNTGYFEPVDIDPLESLTDSGSFDPSSNNAREQLLDDTMSSDLSWQNSRQNSLLGAIAREYLLNRGTQGNEAWRQVLRATDLLARYKYFEDDDDSCSIVETTNNPTVDKALRVLRSHAARLNVDDRELYFAVHDEPCLLNDTMETKESFGLWDQVWKDAEQLNYTDLYADVVRNVYTTLKKAPATFRATADACAPSPE
jgi:hypothetical protein